MIWDHDLRIVNHGVKWIRRYKSSCGWMCFQGEGAIEDEIETCEPEQKPIERVHMAEAQREGDDWDLGCMSDRKSTETRLERVQDSTYSNTARLEGWTQKRAYYRVRIWKIGIL